MVTKTAPSGRIPDTEDLNANGVVDLANSYYEYELLLDTVRTNNPRIVGGGGRKDDGSYSKWYQFRIPVREWVRQVGTPSQENIEFIRVAFVNATDTIAVRIGDFSLVGNQWQKLQRDANDSLFDVTVVASKTIRNTHRRRELPRNVISRDRMRKCTRMSRLLR